MNRGFVGAALAALLLAAACGDDAGPVAGELVVTVTEAPAGARAVLLRVVGPVTSAEAPAGTTHRVFASTGAADTTRIAVIAAQGTTLAAGPLVTLTVPDTRQATQYDVSAVQAANTSYQLIGTGFTFTIARP